MFSYAIATGRGARDHAADLHDAMTPIQAMHHAAITDPKRVGELLRTIDDYKGLPLTRAARSLAPLVFQRPGELRHAEWSKFDLDAAVGAAAAHGPWPLRVPWAASVQPEEDNRSHRRRMSSERSGRRYQATPSAPTESVPKMCPQFQNL